MNVFAKQETATRRNFGAIAIRLASPDKILERSHGEVTNRKP
jgi:hypothetical protein